MDCDFDLDTVVWHLVRKFVQRCKKDFDLRADYGKEEDFFSQARIAALVAVANYDAKKKVKLSTFVFGCVENKLKDMYDYERMRICENDHDSLDYLSEEEVPEEKYASPLTDIADVEFDLTMRAILTKEEYELYFEHFVLGKSMREIGGDSKTKRRGLRECSQRILRKYMSLEENRDRVLIQRSLQNKWLDDLQN